MNIKKCCLTLPSRRPDALFRLLPILSLLAVLLIAGCSEEEEQETESNPQTSVEIECAPDNGGITLPDGFCASLVVDSLGRARHIAVAANGDIYVKTRSEEGGIAALRDTTGDFKADVIERFSTMTPMGSGILWETGMAIHDGYLWASNKVAVYRWPMPEGGALVPEGDPEIVVSGFPEQNAHASKSIAFDNSGYLYVNVGTPSNNCQEEQRTPESPGLDPCPQLERHAGIWRFSASDTGQTFSPDARYATGLRNVVGLDWNTDVGALYVTQHGRDQLNQLWPELYTEEENAELPAEELLRLTEGANAGWPYCYYDWQQEKKVLSPEYGGDGQEVGRCAEYLDPVAAFPGHWAPNGLLFYTGEHFPERYRGGAFVAFHGSWNRAPLPQQGYKVSFVPFEGGSTAGDYETFADGFAGVEPIPNRGAAEYRPMGLAMGPDGALFISDSQEGRIWRVVYTGKENNEETGGG
ncbi:Glucose/arabinose dehydrogenase, beta-propeller fold [Fodinibius roseus]|uniref:Glucose/arabinose dehydrogenase, beta-propeller fold n=1 Tax=Fodinibius roseus TaxID=1194090 RepID=A0A1M5DDS4_9BACT|nr:PQQ-dependent sugar dehydrogenase [Fodinibius roseus]SHF65090.1 Glucose/arabinose dehydrogenase, beta-propeller fold [Fodinibius roseus]